MFQKYSLYERANCCVSNNVQWSKYIHGLRIVLPLELSEFFDVLIHSVFMLYGLEA